jgi:hypothetical protein
MANPNAPMDLPGPIKLGDVIDYDDFRSASRQLLERRAEAVKAFQEQATKTAAAERFYQQTKATVYIQLKNTGGPDGKMISATEAGDRIKGDDDVSEAQVKRDLQAHLLQARREDIKGCDEALATLRKLGEWSMQQRGVN